MSAEHVRRALEGRDYRVNLIEDHIREMAAKGITVFDTTGARRGPGKRSVRP